MRDIIVIGGGICGCAIARELSRYKADVLLLERGNDVSVGTTKANSGIVHGGHDAKPGTKKAYYNVLGNAMFDDLARELEFPFRRNGSLVLCFDESEKAGLTELYGRGLQNGVKGLHIVEGNAAIKEMEPYVSDKAVAALVVPSGGIVSPYEMAIAYAENAAENGVEFRFLSEVNGVKQIDGGFEVTCSDGSVHQSKVIVNCAGDYADDINNMVCKEKLHITARKGDYVLMDKNCGCLADRTLFQLPTKMGKGVLVTPTTHGNILVGPTAADVEDKDDVNTVAERLNEAFDKALVTVPSLSRRDIITQFAGLRAHLDSDDFEVGESSVDNFFNVAGIESPGLTCAPAIAADVAAQAAAKLNLPQNIHFNAHRKAIPQFSKLSDAERQKLIEQNPLYGKIVCRCETVTEGEIVDAIRRPVGAKDLDGVKRRVRAGMGRCQAGFCTPRIMEILARELGCDLQDVTKSGGNSNVVVGRTK
ncbi:MAG: NAD(P)/FAD-dependent oxidoreductase [Corallococcus sp.]|nr:NAD(P)/FAD-dependent oxidoreductase [Corallococcus sp.]MCM1359871.1 NAD(P)/FAD-dependent oxidoreductase [Corallococcus sp.]MCM1395305.1 NAD(P)/FAD-dependent oxidoreductase [Corallococcus sp.]